MPPKVALSRFSLKEFGSYSQFDKGQEKKLLSSLDRMVQAGRENGISIMQCYDLVCVQLAKFLVLVPCADF